MPLKVLIAEDDFASRLLLQGILNGYGTSHVAINGKEALEAVRLALEAGEYYDLICLDIMMPEMDGHEALKQIRALEEASGQVSRTGAKIVMTSALADRDNVLEAIQGQCDHYLAKPIHKAKLLEVLRKLALIA